jgi:hypothetical protein
MATPLSHDKQLAAVLAKKEARQARPAALLVAVKS